MPPRRKTGRAAAEAAYANLLKENTALVGDVGEAFDAFVASLEQAAAARERYEEARAAAVKGGAVTNDQLDQMGYKRTSKLPAPPVKPADKNADTSGADNGSAAAPAPDSTTNGAAAAPQLASTGAQGEGN
ncbi:hypothetical protein Mycsm_07211 (plasmid) [Mycobacterium sp. JS623]|uniref:hypothetical protein n=1 Tax=Mycobacterium sp. JS623 TaxID=212767 RepID=UPI0002A58894|nr:hypothetical protein [Mycobacterium sp. JS623]AGB27305.1 hypothetical protein Mycsm_07211 [Mycobacterium sp. JS623]